MKFIAYTRPTHDLQERINAYRAALQWVQDHKHLPEVLASIYLGAWQAEKKVFFCGNGGSAADAQHIAAEYVGRFLLDGRRPLAALALTTDTSILTAIGNDFGYREVFQRQLRALALPGDVVVFHSTSGKSENLVEAAAYCKVAQPAITTIALLGPKKKCRETLLARYVTHPIFVEAPDGPSTQITHMILQHLAAEVVDYACTHVEVV